MGTLHRLEKGGGGTYKKECGHAKSEGHQGDAGGLRGYAGRPGCQPCAAGGPSGPPHTDLSRQRKWGPH